MRVLFFLAVAVVAFLGFRHLVSVTAGIDSGGEVRPGQRVCHLTSLLVLWLSCGLAVQRGELWPLVIGVLAEWGFRRAIVRSGVREDAR